MEEGICTGGLSQLQLSSLLSAIFYFTSSQMQLKSH